MFSNHKLNSKVYISPKSFQISTLEYFHFASSWRQCLGFVRCSGCPCQAGDPSWDEGMECCPDVREQQPWQSRRGCTAGAGSLQLLWNSLLDSSLGHPWEGLRLTQSSSHCQCAHTLSSLKLL